LNKSATWTFAVTPAANPMALVTSTPSFSIILILLLEATKNEEEGKLKKA
jgi:hypothetical protein